MATTTQANQDSERMLDDQDESVRIAVRALGDMRSGALSSPPSTSFQATPALSIASSTSSPSLPTPSLPMDPSDRPSPTRKPSSTYLSQVSHYPMFNTALRAYEQSKASSRVVKYGAEMMESSLSAVSRPVIDRLGYGVTSKLPSPTPAPQEEPRGRNTSSAQDEWASGLRFRDPSAASTSSSMTSHSQKHELSLTLNDANERAMEPSVPSTAQEVVQRSRWQTVLLEAGGISAAVSDENMRRLRYCLQWLQFAAQRIDAQIVVLRDFVAALSARVDEPLTPRELRVLADAKRDVVQTVREAVEVVSRYAGGALPEPARSTVRGFVLHLPQRWARAAGSSMPAPSAAHRTHGHAVLASGGGGSHGHDVNGASSALVASGGGGSSRRHGHGHGTPYSRPVSPASTAPSSPRAMRSPMSPNTPLSAHPSATTAGAARGGAQRILTLATESLDMMRGVTGVVHESLDRADLWVERLRAVGLQRQRDGASDVDVPLEPTNNGRTETATSGPSARRGPDASKGFEEMTLQSRETTPTAPEISQTRQRADKLELKMEVDE